MDKAHEYILETVKSSDPAVLQVNLAVSDSLVACGAVSQDSLHWSMVIHMWSNVSQLFSPGLSV